MKSNKTALFLIALIITLFFRKLFLSINGIAGNFGDLFLHYYPLKYLITEHLITGKLPLWNPYIFAGQPMLANPQSAVFYPLSIFFYIFPLVQAFNYFYIVHSFAAFYFTYLLAQHLDFSRSTSFLGGMLFALSSFILYNIPAGHPVMLSGFVWLPLIILMFEFRGSVNIRLYTLILALILVFQFFSGHFQPVYITGVLMLIYAFRNRFSNIKYISLAVVFSLLIASLQFLPTLQLSGAIEKSFWPKLVYTYSLPLSNLINLVFPNHFGNVIDGNYIFANNFSYFFERHNLYFGLLPLILSGIGAYLSVKRRNFFYLFLVGIGLILSTGVIAHFDILYSRIPGMNLLRVPARFYLISLYGFIILACTGWETLQKHSGILPKIVLLLIIIIDLFIWNDKFIYTQDMSPFKKKSDLSNIVNPLYRIATDSEMLSSNRSMLYHYYNLNGYEAIFMKKFTDYLGFQEKQVMGPTGMVRIDLASPLSKGLAVGYYISGRNIDLGRITMSLPNGISVFEPANVSPRICLVNRLEFLPNYDKNFEYTPEQFEFLTNTKFSPKELLMVTSVPDQYPRTFKDGNILACSFQSDKILTEANLPSGGTVLFSEIYYPGWNAWAGGRKFNVAKADGCLRTVLLPPGIYTGANRIIMYFAPAIWIIGLIISVLSIICISIFTFSNELTSRIPYFDIMLSVFKLRKED